jgi:diguanylate cyclase (GGDEF)-like protein
MKKTGNYEGFDRLVLVWALCSVVWNIIISLAQPQNYISSIILSLVGIFGFYVFIPNPFYIRVIPPLAYSIYVFLSILVWNQGINPAQIEAITLSIFITNLVGIMFSARMSASRRHEFIARRNEDKIRVELQRLASTDPLTGVLNRRRLLELAAEAFYRFRRYKRPFTIMVMDLDGFKNINDTLGHQQGDSVLVQFAESANREKREADALGRMGGDEFCLVLPETLPRSASVLANRIIKKCEEIRPGGGALVVNVTVSIGISQIREEDGTLDTLFARADAALYIAKQSGRNRLEIV